MAHSSKVRETGINVSIAFLHADCMLHILQASLGSRKERRF
jgi:hypothetical protein